MLPSHLPERAWLCLTCFKVRETETPAAMKAPYVPKGKDALVSTQAPGLSPQFRAIRWDCQPLPSCLEAFVSGFAEPTPLHAWGLTL